jgi:tRNA 2-selenouridine synthase
MVRVAQLVRASDCGSEGRGFETLRAPQKVKLAEMSAFLIIFILFARAMSTRKKFISTPSVLAFTYIDIRPGKAFTRGHIPGSISFPLSVTIASKRSRSRKRFDIERKALSIASGAWAEQIKDKVSLSLPYVLICNDGGICSEFARDALILNHECYIFKDGYKQYRRQVRQTFCRKFQFIVLAGKTGTGKTALLQRLKTEGFQTLDLEALAFSSGSVFGRIGSVSGQPSQEQFENDVYEVLRQFKETEQIYVEQELSNIGHCWIPYELVQQFSKAPKLFLRIPDEERIRLLVAKYARKDDEALKRGVIALTSRIGQDESDILVKLIGSADYSEVAARLLNYYDHSAGYDEKITGQDSVVEEKTLNSLFRKVISIQKKTPHE